VRSAPRGLDLVADPSRVEAALWRRARLEDDAGSRTRLFERYMPLARAVASKHKRWRWRGADRRDLEQLAFEGLLQALDRFDPLVGTPFGAFARRRMTGAIADGMTRMSDYDAQLGSRRRLQQERLRLIVPGGREEDPVEALADLVMDLAIGLMLEGTGMIAAEGEADTRPDPYQSLVWREAQGALAAEVTRLPESEGVVVRQHYLAGLPFVRIADLLRLSRGRVAQLHRTALDRLGRRLRAFRER
jgi:RNA polymerase sigma factor for flagellar operon FliA